MLSPFTLNLASLKYALKCVGKCFCTIPQLSATSCTSFGIALSNFFLGCDCLSGVALCVVVGLTATTPFSNLFSIKAILFNKELTSVSIAGLLSFIRAISIKTLFCEEYFI